VRVASGGSVRAGPSAKAGCGAGRAKLGQVRDAGLGRAGEEGSASGPRKGGVREFGPATGLRERKEEWRSGPGASGSGPG